MTQNNFNIDALVDDLTPVKPINSASAIIVIAAIALISLVAISSLTELRIDLAAGEPSAVFLMRAGILGLLGFATAHSVLTMAKPSVGRHNSSSQIALAFAALFPLGGIIAAMTGDNTLAIASTESVLKCLAYSSIASVATAVPMVLALRRGAPTSPETAGLLTGVASGGLGAFAYSFYCPFDSLAYTGVWYTIAVAMSAAAGRFIIPRLIRW